MSIEEDAMFLFTRISPENSVAYLVCNKYTELAASPLEAVAQGNEQQRLAQRVSRIQEDVHALWVGDVGI